MLLSELFNSTTTITVTGQNDDVVTMEFTLRGAEYMFSASNEMLNSKEESWIVDFGLQRGHDTDYNITGTGNAIEVLSAVQQCIFKLLQLNPNIAQIVFTGSKGEPSRVKMYDRLVRSLKVPGWKARKVAGTWEDFYIFYKDI